MIYHRMIDLLYDIELPEDPPKIRNVIASAEISQCHGTLYTEDSERAGSGDSTHTAHRRLADGSQRICNRLTASPKRIDSRRTHRRPTDSEHSWEC